MKLIELLRSSRPSVSCELFPPKPGTALLDAPTVVRRMAALHPAYMSVTCSAGGSGTGGANTADMANEAQNVNGITALAHLTCVGASRAQIYRSLEDLKKLGIENILALRGDIPAGGVFPPERRLPPRQRTGRGDPRLRRILHRRRLLPGRPPRIGHPGGGYRQPEI